MTITRLTKKSFSPMKMVTFEGLFVGILRKSVPPSVRLTDRLALMEAALYLGMRCEDKELRLDSA